MMRDRATARVAAWLNGISWLLRLNRRLETAASRWRPVRVILATLAAVTRNDAQQLNAGIAYYGMVALIPVSVAILQLSAIAVGQENSLVWFESWSSQILPAAIDLKSLRPPGNPAAFGITGVFALLGLTWGSYKLFSSVGVVVNRMWGIEPSQVGIIAKTREYLLMSATAIVLLLSTVSTYAITRDLAPWALGRLDSDGWTALLLYSLTQGWLSNIPAGFLSGAAFLIIFRYVPERPVRWQWAAIGAGVAGVALQLVNYGVAIFIAYVAPSHLIYGPVASALVVLVWLYAASVTVASGAAVGAYGQNVYHGDGPIPGPGWFLGNQGAG